MSELAVRVEQLSFTYPGRAEPNLRDISFNAAPGSWTVLAGGTGSGKSTLLRALAGLIPHHSAGVMSGTVRLFEQDTRDVTVAKLARTVGLVLQSPDDQICTTRVESEVAFGLENLATPVDEIGPRVAAALTSVGLESQIECLTAPLSGGQKQRLVLASILALAPRVILLDEPMSQLEAGGARDLLTELDRLRAQGATIIIAEHRLADILPQCDQLLVLDDGRLTFRGRNDDPGLGTAFEAAGLELPTDRDNAVRSQPLRETSTEASRDILTERSRLALCVQGLAFRYPSAEGFLWRDVSFDLQFGERIALVGPNGSGKSTLFAVLAGLLKPAHGNLEFVQSPRDRRPLGLVLQQPDLMLFARTVRDELAFGPRQLGLTESRIDERVTRVARQLDLSDLLQEAPQALSHGQRLRVAVAATMTLEPGVLILDEPTAGLDRRQLDRLMQEIDPRRNSADGPRHAVIFSTHDLRTVDRYADRVLILEGGALSIDTPVSSVFKLPS